MTRIYGKMAGPPKNVRAQSEFQLKITVGSYVLEKLFLSNKDDKTNIAEHAFGIAFFRRRSI